MTTIEKIYPTEEELSIIDKNISCPECSNVFKSRSNLNLHLAKTHKQSHLLESIKTEKIYCCPINSCPYNTSSHFTQLKLLKQHYLKVHSEKSYLCHLCMKGFTTETFRDRHVEYCDVQFKCCNCDMSYESYETLKTHCRRKGHQILQKSEYKTNTTVKSVPHIQVSPDLVKTQRKLLPKMSNVNIFIVANTMEQSSQTDKQGIFKRSQSTQTTDLKSKFSTETQTSQDLFELNDNRSIKTQTTITNRPNGRNFQISDFDLSINDIGRNSSSTQTTLNEYSQSTGTHTDEILAESMDLNDFFYNNMETQTDSIFDDELFKCCDDYANMYTQTCAELLGDMEFNQNQTQTVLETVLKSVESQTVVSQNKRIPLSCKDISHMEIQTDLNFKQILEQINA